MADKKEIISKVYNEFDGSIKETLRRSKERSIYKICRCKTLVRDKLYQKTNLRGYNSYIADYPHQEYEMDLLFINDLEDQDYYI